jgi:putative addiction module component (TIGR02574 family)
MGVASRHAAAGRQADRWSDAGYRKRVACSLDIRTTGALDGGGGVLYHGRMTKAADAVLADALRLEPEARAEIAAELLASLDGPADPDADAAWSEEIEKRIAAIEAGTMKLESWDDVKRRISEEILGR